MGREVPKGKEGSGQDPESQRVESGKGRCRARLCKAVRKANQSRRMW